MFFDFLQQSIQARFTPVRTLKDTPAKQILLLRHTGTGALAVQRTFSGSAAVYQRLLRVDCPNLPHVLEAAESGGRVLVLEEFIPGDGLASLLEGGRTLAPNQAVRVARDVCGALWALHCLGIVHRDVKPANIILRGDTAVLIDLDAARQYDQSLQRDTQVLGTMGYASPEQFGLSQTDQRTDIYALGVTLNIMLTGAHPARALAPGRLGRVVQRCTMVSPEKRYPNVLRLMAAL